MNMPFAGLLLTICVIVLGIVDLAFVVFHGAPSSVSNFMIRMGFQAPMVVFAFGFVSGHLFGYMKLEPTKASKEELDRLCKEKDES